MTAGSTRPDQAYELLRQLASPELDRITSEEGATGTRLSTWRDPEVQAIAPYYAVLEAVHEHAISPPSDPRWPAVVRILSDAVDDAIHGRATPRAALERAAVRVDSEVRSA